MGKSLTSLFCVLIRPYVEDLEFRTVFSARNAATCNAPQRISEAQNLELLL